MAQITRVCLIAMAMAGCEWNNPQGVDRSNAAAAAGYFSVRDCWLSGAAGEPLRGALAIYKATEVEEVLVFSGRCPITGGRYEDVMKVYRVRVGCVHGIPAVTSCKRRADMKIDQQIFDPGNKPEFPNELYVFEGTMSAEHTLVQGHLIFATLDVKQYQKLPREMIGAFLYDPGNWRPLIAEYLDTGNLDADGYKRLK
jgi:hypothetical protein